MLQWMVDGQNGPNGPPVGQSAHTGAVASVRLRPPGTEESTAAAA